MKKNLWFLMSLILLFTSCSNEELGLSYQTQDGTDAKANHFYGAKSSGADMTKGVAQKTNLWYNGSVISVGFVNGSDADKEKVKLYAAEWEKHANIEFEFVDSGDALVRVGFDWNDERYITWSYVGTDCKNVTDQNEATMSFAYWDSSTEEEIKGDVLRAFGQLLGLELEHRHLEFDAGWTNKISEYWEGEIEDIPWESLQKYVFTPLNAKQVIQTAEYDENSIMIWPFAKKYAKNTARSLNYELSDMDIAFIGQLYPKDGTVVTPPISAKSTVLTFTEEVELPLLLVLVDGDVKIIVDGKLAYQGSVAEAPQTLKGTTFDIKAEKLRVAYEIGAVKMPRKMKTLHLTDIEYTNLRLQSQTLLEEITLGGIPYYAYVHADQMFMDCWSLKSIPKGLFDNSPNLTSFGYAFSGCKGLTSIPKGLFDNSPNLTSFGYVFSGCKGLTSIPKGLFDNSPNLTSFGYAFSGCKGLTSIPDSLFANCPKVTSFAFTFSNCTSLTAIPENLFTDCPNARDFFNTFEGCRSLTSLPEGLFANQKKTARTWGLFANCSGLTSIPEGLFSSFTEHRGFSNIFENCVSLTSIPENLFANCIRAEDFNSTFLGCRNLTVIPARLFANNIKVTNFGGTFAICTSLTSIPSGLFANNTKTVSFDATFSGCLNLQVVPKYLFTNCSAVTSFNNLFRDCNTLKTIPNNLFPNSGNEIQFHAAFSGCSELTEIPADLFANCFNAVNFDQAFYKCVSLKSIPAGLLNNCPNVQSFRNVFSQCNSITSVPENLFSKSTKATNFENAFLSCSLIQSSVPKLWESHPSAKSTQCFRGTTQATNYADIPTEWK